MQLLASHIVTVMFGALQVCMQRVSAAGSSGSERQSLPEAWVVAPSA